LTFPLITFAKEKAVIGMTIYEVKKIYQAVKKHRNENGAMLSRPDNLYGLNDTRGYGFKKEKLTWIFFHKYIKAVDDTNFRKCLSAIRQLVKDYTKLYGRPDTTITGDTIFVDPFKKHHWGYDVIEVR
jgi:hypothetical protein